MNINKKRSLVAAVFAGGVLLSTSAVAQYNFSEEFDNTLETTDATGNWIAQYTNAGGNYNQNDTGTTNWAAYASAVSAPPVAPPTSNGEYLNFYARYDDPGIRYTALFKNLGGYGADDPYSANNGEHVLTACYFLNDVADGGADLSNGVTAGLGVRYSGAGYSAWPGDASLNESISIPTYAARGRWNRLTLSFTLTDAARVDSGVWVRNPVLSEPYVSTGVLWDDMWLGAAADAPTDELCSGRSAGNGAFANPDAIPVLPLGGLLGLISLVGLMGLRRKM
jgi:hypothetical protein